jgi:hypothetical protein
MIHVKFAYEGQVCDLYPHEASILAVSRDHIVLITNHLLPQCNVHEHKLCMIPAYAQQSTQVLNCAAGVLKRKSVKELYNSCSFRCAKNSDLLISQIDAHTLIVTNAKEIIIKCGNTTEHYSPHAFGAVELHLSCKCNFLIDGKDVKQPFPCVESGDTDFKVIQSVPILWTVLDHAIGKDSILITSNHSQLMKDDWHKVIPVMNMTTGEVSIPDPVVKGMSMDIIWLISLTSAFACILFIQFVVCIVMTR